MSLVRIVTDSSAELARPSRSTSWVSRLSLGGCTGATRPSWMTPLFRSTQVLPRCNSQEDSTDSAAAHSGPIRADL